MAGLHELLVGRFTGDGKADLLVRTNDGDMLLYPFKDGSFYKGGGPIKVGNGWSFTNYFLADWTGDGVPDLLVRTAAGDCCFIRSRTARSTKAAVRSKSAMAGILPTTSSRFQRRRHPRPDGAHRLGRHALLSLPQRHLLLMPDGGGFGRRSPHRPPTSNPDSSHSPAWICHLEACRLTLGKEGRQSPISRSLSRVSG